MGPPQAPTPILAPPLHAPPLLDGTPGIAPPLGPGGFAPQHPLPPGAPRHLHMWELRCRSSMEPNAEQNRSSRRLNT